MLAIGVFPGLGSIAGLSLVLPFMFGLDPVYGLALMIGMVAVVPTSDTFASVLMGIWFFDYRLRFLMGFQWQRKDWQHVL